MSNKIKEAFECITADAALRERTARSVINQVKQRQRPALGRSMCVAAAAACLMMLLVGAYRVYMTPVATISVDINPSIELSVNRFDRVVGVKAFNDDGQAVLSAVDIRNMCYTDAIAVLLSSDALGSYLTENADISIMVLGDTEERSAEMLDCVRTESYARWENVYCGSGHHENAAAAHAVGMSLGKYEAYLILRSLDGSVTPEDVRDLSMREIRLRIEALGGNMPNVSDTADSGTHHDQSHGSSSGHSHGSGHE